MRFFLFIFIYVVSLLAVPEKYCIVEQSSSEYIVLQFDFPEFHIPESEISTENIFLEIPGLTFNYEENKPLLPIYYSSFVAPEGRISWQILSKKIETYPSVYPIHYDLSSSEGALQQSKFKSLVYPTKIVSVKDVGIFRDYRIMGLIIYPFQVTPQGIIYYKSLKIRVNLPAKSSQLLHSLSNREKVLFDKFALNSERLSNISPVILSFSQQSSTPVFNINTQNTVKFYVDKKGIYKVTGEDLDNAGINIQNINPQTFRMINKGKDIAVYIYGDQDLVFDLSDYIEFLGEPNEKTMLDQFKDLYVDPFSNENVYWLTWGGTPGIRMVEESGAIVQTNPSLYNPTQFYPYTIHYEKNSFFERFGFGNTQNLTHKRDSWFFDSGIQAIRKKSYNVKLQYPDSSSFNPVLVKMLFAGKSQTNHTMMVWLNQRLVGQTSGVWFNQDVFELNNFENSSIRAIDLQHGDNEFEIQMPAMGSDGKSDHVLFNWADVTYDKQYKAVDNYLEFTRPSPSVIYYPQISLFQFELYNFNRSDIEIYKKGISKIVNYNLSVQEGRRSKNYKITFQDNIYSNDVEYIALSSNAKLKPKRIVKEEPFDPNNPTQSLMDPSNSADYLIITHERFFDRAEELADYRRQSGLHVVLVDVEDIYDEFNYGLKSPLAIKKFLQYAFYNWDKNHRLKFVLLLGDGNYNYKSNHVVYQDFVPTFFYQSYEFGAVATDHPYSLVSGTDDLPDLFVGRIPVTTNGEVSNVISKIREFEETPLINLWRNQTLFISGKDINTYEFRNVPNVPRKPAFRTQNQRIIDMLIDKKYSTFKLNTIEDENLPYDPNFGGTTDLIDYIDNGVKFINFFGHGGGGVWADVDLLNLQDIDRLNNKGKYPFVTSMTCFTGAFDNPGSPGLAQKLLLSIDKGAIGIFASSGLGWLANDYSMLWNVMKYIDEPQLSLGESISLGKIGYFINSQYVLNDTIVPGNYWGHGLLKYDMIYQYNLIGDPYIFITSPQNNIDISVDNELPAPGDTINVQIDAPLSLAEGYIELANGKNEILSRRPLFYIGEPAEQQMTIPQDYQKGAGYIRAYLSDNNLDAVGVKQIGINFSVFDSVHTIPAIPNAEDSVGISLKVKEDIDITEVKIVAVLPKGVLLQDTIHLATRLVGPSKYETTSKIPPTLSLSTVYYFVHATNVNGQTSHMNYNYKVTENRPDPRLYNKKIKLVGAEQVKLGVSVGNDGYIPVENVEIRVYNGQQNFQNDQPFDIKSISITGRDSTTILFDFPFPLNVSNYDIYATVDRYHNSPDFNRTNNTTSNSFEVNMYNLTPEYGSTYDNTKNDTIIINNAHKFWLAEGEIDRSSAVGLDLIEIPSQLQQTNLEVIPLKNSNDPVSMNVYLFNREVQLNSSFLLQLYYNKEYVESQNVNIDMLYLYKWDERIHAWIQHEALLDTIAGSLSADIVVDGFYTTMISDDQKPPRIELTVDGRQIRTSSLVSPNPVLNILVEDESGLNISREQIILTINGINIPEEKVFIPDSVEQSNVLGITAYPELETGIHELSIEVRDVNGNGSEKTYNLQVGEDFELKVFGNYPNPFDDYTIFSYYITSREIIDDIEIRIFTTSGRLIKRIKNDINTMTPGNDPRRVGYNELMWDGTDDNGVQVVNGVYFALIRAKYGDKEHEVTLKVAKLK